MRPIVDIDVTQKLADLSKRSEKERKRFHARRPKAIASIVANVMAKQGYAASKASSKLTDAWREQAEHVLGDAAIASQTMARGLSRGVLEVVVANHTVMQEINFHRPRLLEASQAAMPDARIRSIRFKVGRVNT
ncbi:MAG: DUF721 domain-containing protein [Planctomycetota bacterium]